MPINIKIFKKLLPFAIIFSVLILAGTVSYGLYLLEKNQPTNEPATDTVIVEKIISESSPSPTPSSSPLPQPKKITKPKSTVQPSPQLIPQPSQSPQTVTVANPEPSKPPTPSPTPVIQKYQISVSIDGGSAFSLAIEEGKNHCDVLSQALQEGKLSSLNMQFNSSYNSYGVYQINGLGQTDQVWWGYKINDKSPAYGCSYIKVQNNDDVRWTYVGPR
jgi:hypothetical protein